MRSLILAAIGCVFLASATVGQTPAAQSFYNNAKKAYDTGNFTLAAELFEKGFSVDSDDPVLPVYRMFYVKTLNMLKRFEESLRIIESDYPYLEKTEFAADAYVLRKHTRDEVSAINERKKSQAAAAEAARLAAIKAKEDENVREAAQNKVKLLLSNLSSSIISKSWCVSDAPDYAVYDFDYVYFIITDEFVMLKSDPQKYSYRFVHSISDKGKLINLKTSELSSGYNSNYILSGLNSVSEKVNLKYENERVLIKRESSGATLDLVVCGDIQTIRERDQSAARQYASAFSGYFNCGGRSNEAEYSIHIDGSQLEFWYSDTRRPRPYDTYDIYRLVRVDQWQGFFTLFVARGNKIEALQIFGNNIRWSILYGSNIGAAYRNATAPTSVTALNRC